MSKLDCPKVRPDCELGKVLRELTEGSILKHDINGEAVSGKKMAFFNGTPCCASMIIYYLACQCNDPMELIYKCREFFVQYFGDQRERS